MEGMVMASNFWKSKKVLVTGHTGFKGSWLCLWLTELGAEVIGYSLEAPTEPNLFSLADVSRSITSLYGDVRDLKDLTKVAEKYSIDIIIHLAAQSLVNLGYDNPVDTYSTNVMGTVNVLESARQVKSVKVVVNVTSDKCYENKESLWGYRENDRLGGRDPYSNSKGCAELVTTAYRSSYFDDQNVAVATARAGNVIGGGDWATDRLIPDVVRCMTCRNELVIRHPDAVRPWQHVLEPLSGYLLLAEKMSNCPGDYNGAWNFGPTIEDTNTVQWVLGEIQNNLDHPLKYKVDRSPHNHKETFCLKLDSSKASTLLGWNPRLRINDAINWTIDWYKNYINGQDMHEFTLNQIRHYGGLV